MAGGGQEVGEGQQVHKGLIGLVGKGNCGRQGGQGTVGRGRDHRG